MASLRAPIIACLLGAVGARVAPPAFAARPLSEAGRPFVTAYAPRDYRAHNQIWETVQSPEGLLYFGNSGRVLEFDGTTWKRIPVPGSFVRRLAYGADGRLYVGATDMLGWIERDPAGESRFRSLLDQVPAAALPLGMVTDVTPHGDAVYFTTVNGVLRWQHGRMRFWPGSPDRKPPWLSIVGPDVYLHRTGAGLFRLQNDEWKPLSTDPRYTQSHMVLLTAGEPGAPLVLVREGTLGFLRPDGSLAPWHPETAALLARTRLRIAQWLDDGSLALATDTLGVLRLARDGRVVERFDQSTGLENASLHALFQDRDGGLWINTNNGTFRTEPASPFSVFDRVNGLGRDAVRSFCRHDGVLYAAVNDQLHRLVPADLHEHGSARFERIPLEYAFPWALVSHRSGLLIGGAPGIARLEGGRLSWVIRNNAVRVEAMTRSLADPDRIWCSHEGGLRSIRYVDGEWRDEGLVSAYRGPARDVAEAPDGTLWLGTPTRGFVRITRPAGDADWSRATFRTYFETHGLPPDQGWSYVHATSSGPLFTASRGIYRFDAAAERFVPEPRLAPEGRADARVAWLAEAADGSIWLETETPEENSICIQKLMPNGDGTYAWSPQPRAIEEHLGYSGAKLIWRERTPAGEDTVWISGNDATVRVVVSRLAAARPPAPWRAMIRSARFPGLAGAAADGVRAPYSHEPIAFSFAAPRFGTGGPHHYQTRLLGFDDAWSPWSDRPEVTFTNLSGGPFTLEVRARDFNRAVSAPARFVFSVAPPWHRTPWAVGAYGIAAAAAVLGLVRWRLRHAARERARLEQLVAQRTEELRHAKEIADEANRAKSAFLANMSHELRTPLNGVIGYAQVLMKDRDLTPRNRERIRIVQTSGEHLLRMINEVLDFSKIEAGRMELSPAPFHLPQLLRDVAAAISPRFEQKQLAFHFEPAPALPDLVLGDPLKLRQVLDNLLGNALKFTPAGEVRLEITPADRAEESVTFRVTDTGVGIGPADRARLFQPFHQAVDGRPPEPGTGLGLAIARRLVELMGGTLGVESEPGRGSVFGFTIRLPVIAADAEADRRAAGVISGYRGRRRRILIVDDVATNRAVLRELLVPLGFELAEAASGAEALAAAPGLGPDLVLLDLRMPGIDGFELARRLRARPGGAALKLIAMSASVLSFSREDAFAAGCDDFLSKPFREDDLLARIGQALQVEWIGDPGTAVPSSADPAPATTLSAAVIAELLASARRGEIAALRRRLGELRGDPLADALEALAKSYRMENIRALLEAQSSPARPPSP